MKNNQYLGDGILLIAALIWGFGYVAVVFALNSGGGEYFITAARFGIASLLQIPFIYPKLKQLNKSIISKGIILGLLLVGGFISQTIGQKSTTTTNVAFLTSVNVVLIPFTSLIIFRKKLSLRSVIAAFITLIGLGFLSIKDNLSINPGDFYVIICAALFAAYSSVTDFASKKEDPQLLVFIQMLTAALSSSIIFFFSAEKLELSPALIANIFYLGCFSNLIATLLYTYGLKYSSAERGSIIVSVESVFGAILGILIFKEAFSYKLIIGSSLILFAILYSEKIILKPNKNLSSSF